MSYWRLRGGRNRPHDRRIPGMLEGKTGIVFGVANHRSLAWFIARQAHRHGAKIQLVAANERFRDKMAPHAEKEGIPEPLICDVTQDESIEQVFEQIQKETPQLDFLVHSIAFARKEDLEGRFVETTREGYLLAQNISSYSFVALMRAAEPLMTAGSNALTLTYIGSQRSVPNYNVMGVAKAALESTVRYLAADFGPSNIRVNAISAGPIKTLSSAGIAGLREKLDLQHVRNPLRRNIEGDDVGKAAVFLLSDYAAGVTGEVLYVDNGYHSCATWA